MAASDKYPGYVGGRIGAEKKPAGLVLKELREKLAADPAKYGPMFGPSKSEREYDAYVEAKTKKQDEERAAKAAAAAAAAASKGGPEEGVTKTDKPKIEPKPVVTPETLAERERASAGRAGTFVPDEEPSPSLISSLGDSTATIRKGALLAKSSRNIPEGIAKLREKRLPKEIAKVEGRLASRAAESAARDAKNMAEFKRAGDANKRAVVRQILEDAKNPTPTAGKTAKELADFQRAAAADEAAKKKVVERVVKETKATSAADVADTKKLDKLKKAASALDAKRTKYAAKAAAAAEKAAKAGNLAKSARLLGKFASKAAVPLEIGMSAYEGYKLLTDEDQRRARKAEFEGYANRGRLVSAGAAFLNPVAGLYATGSALGDLSDSARGAAESEEAYREAKMKFDSRQAALNAAMARGEIQKMTPELAKQIRALPEKERIAFRKARNAQFAKFR